MEEQTLDVEVTKGKTRGIQVVQSLRLTDIVNKFMVIKGDLATTAVTIYKQQRLIV